MRRRVASHLAPQPGDFSPAVATDDLVFVSAQLPLDTTGRPVAGDLTIQMARALDNVRLHLQATGLDLDTVARITVYVLVSSPDAGGIDERTMAALDAALATTFRPPQPACSIVGVAALPHRAAVAVDAVAVRY